MSPSFSRSSLLKIVVAWVSIFLVGIQVSALKSPFRPRDLLPHMPKKISLPAYNSLHSPVDILPVFVGVASSTVNTSDWKGACFNNHKAWMVFHNKTGSQFGGGTLHIEAKDPHSWTCLDLYIFATPYRVTWDFYFRGREHTLEIKEWKGKDEYEYVKNHGISIFLMKDGMLWTLEELWETFSLLSNTRWGEKSNIEFLKKHMGATFEVRPKPWVTSINVDDIQSGDFLAVSKIRGPWGAFETLQKWATGAYAGHVAVCLRDSHGKLWVGESEHENEKGEDIIALMPWDEWWDLKMKKDEFDPHIALLPLHPNMRARFNESAAWEFAESMAGHPYGYHNMIFSWIDTLSDNYPPPLNANLILYSDWIYSDGKSTSCVAFLLSGYKVAGLFDPIASYVQVTEFTIKDAYSLKFFENNMSRLPKWCNDGDNVKLAYCQIKGKYRMELPGYNTMEPYPHMNEKCPSLPPKYTRPANC